MISADCLFYKTGECWVFLNLFLTIIQETATNVEKIKQAK